MENIEITKSNQVWQAEIAKQVYETNLEELKSWIVSGKLQPHHNVRVKNLIWVEADRVPAFNKLFEEKKNGNISTVSSAPVTFAVAYPELNKPIPSINLPIPILNPNPSPNPNPNPKKIPTLDELLEEMKRQSETEETAETAESDVIEIEEKDDVPHLNCPSCQAECVLEKTEAGIDQLVLVSEEGKGKKKSKKIKEIEDFKILTPLDREYKKVGFISAFLMALLFSSSLSYFWVYQIAFVEEPVPPPTPPTAEQNANKVVDPNSPAEQEITKQDSGTTTALNTKQATVTPDGKCIDPETNLAFECSEEMRKVFEEEAKKKESVANAQKQVKNKTNLILRLVMPSSWLGEEEQAKQETVTFKTVVDEFRNDPNGQRFLTIFGISFIIIFGLLILSRIISNKKKIEADKLTLEQTNNGKT